MHRARTDPKGATPHIADRNATEVQTVYGGHRYGVSSQEAACVGALFTTIYSFDEVDISMTGLTHDGYQDLCSASSYNHLVYLSPSANFSHRAPRVGGITITEESKVTHNV